VVSCTSGTRSWRCRECGATLHLPWDWCLPLHRQPPELRPAQNRMILRHARQTPDRHRRLLGRYTRILDRTTGLRR